MRCENRTVGAHIMFRDDPGEKHPAVVRLTPGWRAGGAGERNGGTAVAGCVRRMSNCCEVVVTFGATAFGPVLWGP